MAFNDYLFIYKDANGRFNKATNPRFIASHTKCVAVPKETIEVSYNLWSDFIYDLNVGIRTDKVMDIAIVSDLKQIL